MSSTNKTTNYGLNQWTGTDSPLREDFNNDNLIIDGKLRACVDSLSTHADDNSKHINLSDKALLSELMMQQDIAGKIFSTNLNKFYTDFQHTMSYSDGQIDNSNVQLSGSLAAGATTITVPSAAGISAGMEISVQDQNRTVMRTLL